MKLWITGSGVVSPAGDFSGEVAPEPTSDGEPRVVPEDFPLREPFGSKRTRWLDMASLFWINAANQALRNVPPEKLSTIGQVLGSTWGPTEPSVKLEKALWEEGFQAIPPAVFPNSVGNAPASQAGLLLGLKGPVVALSGKEAAGLLAVVEGCGLVRSGVMDTCIAGGADHIHDFLLKVITPLRGKNATPPGEGAGALLIEGGQVPPPSAVAGIAGWANLSSPLKTQCFPDDPRELLDRILKKLLARTGWQPGEVGLFAVPEDTRRLATLCREWADEQMPNAAGFSFQPRLGACGASWAIAMTLVAKKLFTGKADKAIMIALSTGGTGVGIALNAVDGN